MPSPAPDTRAARRLESRKRRIAKARDRREFFELIVAGHSHEQVADALGVSIRTVRREVDRVIAARPSEAPERFARLQVARLSKALLVVDHALEQCDLRAVGPLMKVVAELSRYHGLETMLAASPPPRPALPAPAAAPLALTDESEKMDKKVHLTP